MKIETKYNIGQKVWYISGYKAVCRNICGVSVSTLSNEYCYDVVVYYRLRRDGMSKEEQVEEKFIFPTKEELLKSL